MNKVVLTFILVFALAFSAKAQIPQGMNYQAVLRDANGEIMSNTNVQLRFTIKRSFFDIAYQAEKKVDNVNRRKQLYPYELPILTWSESDNPLDLNDLLVTIEQQEVVLKSKKLDKRLLPRIASAYNYTRSDLAVYRFLCDIQSQGILTNLSFKLRDFGYNVEPLSFLPPIYASINGITAVVFGSMIRKR